MKKYLVKVRTLLSKEEGGKEYNAMYECNGFESAKNWTGRCLRLDEVNTLEIVKGKEKRKERKRGVYVTIDLMYHWVENTVEVFDNETKELIWKNH